MKLFNHKYPVPVILFIMACLFLYLKPGWLDTIENTFSNLNYTLRGSRDVNDNICVVFLGDEDIKALGEWPITRDYYSYLIHILKSNSTKTIGIDILFSHPDKGHPEYDKTLADFLRSAGNVCLPMTFSLLKESDNSIIKGENPTFPFDRIRENAAEIGFSNFGKNTFNKCIPVKATYNDSGYYSFGYQLAKNFLGTDDIGFSKNKILLNHFGKLSKIKTMSFLNLLHTFQKDPDSLFFQDKLVLFSVTASGLSTLKSTPLVESLPASIIHLTVAENLIYKNYLTEISIYSQIIILLLLFVIMFFIAAIRQQKITFLLTLFLILVYWTIDLLSFSLLNTVIPTFLPLIFVMLCSGSLFLNKQYQQNLNDQKIKDILQEQIEKKESQLAAIKKKLQDESLSASDAKKLAEERKQSIIRLEKEINDLQIHSLPLKDESIIHSDIIRSQNSPMNEILGLVSKISSSDIPVLIMGETGTGKELIARVIHQKSGRFEKPFVAINCGALPENLLESELFGHEKGTFTGAVSLRKGRFELAADGTIFLDEITETTASFQIKLLRVLQEGTFERLGGEKTLKTNVRIIAASNKNIQEEIDNSNFRSDLFYRLNGFPITLPNLRNRIEDIEILAIHFLKKYGYDINISVEAMRILQSYQWPGNVRELENIMRRAALFVISENRKFIQEKDLAPEIKDSNVPLKNIYYPLDDQILETLRSFRFSHSAISQTAKILDNRDRGTITEYFRGLCFEHYVKANFNKHEAAHQLAQNDDPEIIEKVESKISTYLENLQKHSSSKETAIKGLPKKYHTYLEKIIENLSD